MDEINDFFNFSKSFERQTISAGYVNGRTIKAEEAVSVKREHQGTEYVEEFRAREHDNLSKAFIEHDMGIKPSPSSISNLTNRQTQQSHLNDLESLGGNEDDFSEYGDDDGKSSMRSKKMPRLESDNCVYDRYQFNYVEPDLPIVGSRAEILQTIDTHPVTVLQGNTGCGKSTQLPQFILDQAQQRREHCNIVVTQPRRIAARSIASRVCAERKWECGSLVGYQVGLSCVSSEDTRLLFCTTGVLLEKLVRSRSLAAYTHIVLDEVHERDQDMDFLFIVVRKLLCDSPQCKIVLMSATIEASQFADYWRIGNRVAPIVSVDTQRPFDVKEFYLCDLARLRINADIDICNPCIETSMYEGVRRLVVILERIDRMDQQALVQACHSRPTILIFLPGILEIETLYKHLEEDANTEKYQLFPLHSSITFEEQQRVFRPVPAGLRKIILSTNIAESSVTIPDVKYVIDFCLTKTLATDTATNFSSLQLCWASRNNCIQRSGRAGRVMDGRVYRLVPRIFFEDLMSQSCAPEMTRSPLERVVLKSKMLDMGAPHAILASAMDPPNLGDIQNTILQLKAMGGLFRAVNGVFVEHDGDLTFLGRVMAALPVDVRVARLIVFGYCFSALDECIIIAAGLNVKSIFNNPFSKGLQAYTKKLRWSDGSGSDLFAILKAYRCWIGQVKQRGFVDDHAERLWANRFFLQVRSLKEMAHLIEEITDRLDRVGISKPSGVNAVHWTSAELSIVLKCVIAGAFYPNYFMRMPFHQENDRDAHKELCGRDPSSTVFFRGFNHKHIGALYTRAIKQMFSEVVKSTKQLHVSFDPGTEKIFVQFRPLATDLNDEYVETMPGQVSIDVYKSVKMRLCNNGRIMLAVMDPKEAADQAEQMGLGINNAGHWVPRKRLYKNVNMIAVPLPAVKQVHGIVSNLIDPHCFHFQTADERTFVQTIFEELNAPNDDLRPFRSPQEVRTGQSVVCIVAGERHRARILQCIGGGGSEYLFHVRLIDFGYEQECKLIDLLRYGGGASAQYADIPPRVFECRLAELQPSQLTAEKGMWTSEAIKAFSEHVLKGQPSLTLEVYSVVDRVAHVVVHAGPVNINEYLVMEGLAQVCEETYASKCDHIRRVERQKMPFDEHTNLVDEQLLQLMAENPSDDEDVDVPAPSAKQCHQQVQLSGPHSPLEAHVFGAAGSAANRRVRIEAHSVNSVMLEDRSQDVHNNVLVAANVTCQDRSGDLVARETSQMPNIPGFGALMALIFCPIAELKPDAERTRIVSVLCGLGWNRDAGRPVFDENDVRFELDVELIADDLAHINQIRFTMDTLLYTKQGEEQPELLKSQKNHYMMKIKERIIQLLERQRDRISAVPNVAHHWSHDTDVQASSTKNVYGDRTIFSFHDRINMSETGAQAHQQLVLQQRERCALLHRTARLDLSMREPLMCTVCQIALSSAPEVKMHLYSRLHVDREKYIGYVNE